MVIFNVGIQGIQAIDESTGGPRCRWAARKLPSPSAVRERPGGELELAASKLRAGLAALGFVGLGIGLRFVLTALGTAEARSARSGAVLDHPVAVGGSVGLMAAYASSKVP
jgi:hypothetical protein